MPNLQFEHVYSLIGYLSVGNFAGFKTPILKNSGLPSTQRVDKEGIITCFVVLSDEDVGDAVYPNVRLPKGEVKIGDEERFLFRCEFQEHCSDQEGSSDEFNQGEAFFYGTRAAVTEKLRSWLRRSGNQNAVLTLEVMRFIGMDEGVVRATAEVARLAICEMGFDPGEIWVKSFVKGAGREAELRREREIARHKKFSRSYARSLKDFEAQASEWIAAYDGADKDRIARLWADVIDNVNTLHDGDEQVAHSAYRRLLATLGRAEDVRGTAPMISLYLRAIYIELTWQRYCRFNLLKAGIEDKEIKLSSIDKSSFDDFLNVESENLFESALRVLKRFKIPKYRVFYRPGLIAIGEVLEYNAGQSMRIIFQDETVEIEEDVLSKNPLLGGWNFGDLTIFAFRRKNAGTMKGFEYIRDAFDIFVPGLTNFSQIFLGASSSWLVIKLPRSEMSILLQGKGKIINQIIFALGLRRLTLIPTFPDDENGIERELRHFVNNAWSALVIRRIEGKTILLDLPNKDGLDLRIISNKVRTFSSMFEKVFSGWKCEYAFKTQDLEKNNEFNEFL